MRIIPTVTTLLFAIGCGGESNKQPDLGMPEKEKIAQVNRIVENKKDKTPILKEYELCIVNALYAKASCISTALTRLNDKNLIKEGEKEKATKLIKEINNSMLIVWPDQPKAPPKGTVAAPAWVTGGKSKTVEQALRKCIEDKDSNKKEEIYNLVQKTQDAFEIVNRVTIENPECSPAKGNQQYYPLTDYKIGIGGYDQFVLTMGDWSEKMLDIIEPKDGNGINYDFQLLITGTQGLRDFVVQSEKYKESYLGKLAAATGRP